MCKPARVGTLAWLELLYGPSVCIAAVVHTAHHQPVYGEQQQAPAAATSATAATAVAATAVSATAVAATVAAVTPPVTRPCDCGYILLL